MRRTVIRTALAVLVLVECVSGQAEGPAVGKADYTWKNVAIGGGGAVIGLVVHPAVKDLVYIRTDVGGIYRWEPGGDTWIPLLDAIPSSTWNLYGGDSIAVDPTDKEGKVVYLSAGKYANPTGGQPNGAILKSVDRGAHWKQVLADVGGTVKDSESGERLAVDPHNGRHVLYASRSKGLLESDDAGETWRQNTHLPAVPVSDQPNARDQGLLFSLFDPSSGADAQRRDGRIAYVGAAASGIFATADGGASWRLMAGSPKNPRRACVAAGVLFVSHAEGVARYSAAEGWQNITPQPGKYYAIAVDPGNPRHLVTILNQNKKNGPMFRSTDGGGSWKTLKCGFINTVPWWNPEHTNLSLACVFSLSLDPFHPSRAWATDWYGIYRTEDITADVVLWTNCEAGHEEVVCTGALAAPPESRFRLYSGVADVGGFDHESLDRPPTKLSWDRGYKWQTTTGIAWQPADQDFLVRVGTLGWNKPGKGGAYSLDGGQSWQLFPTLPYKNVLGGRVAIAGRGKRIIWAPQLGAPYLTDDLGKSWRKLNTPLPLAGVTRGGSVFSYGQPLAVDLADPDRVYILYQGQLLRSDDAGDTWRIACASVPPRGSNLFTSGRKDDLWAWGSGLLHSRDGGATWEEVPGVNAGRMACAGRNPPGKDHAAIFLFGKVQGVNGYFRSDDLGLSWLRIDTTPGQAMGDDPNTMCGDWRLFGGLFVGTNGRGIFHGAPQTK